MNLSVKIGKLTLKNPVMAASGTFGCAREFEEFFDLKKLGAIVTKTITLNPRQGNPMPRTYETASGMLNAIGLQNEGIDNFIKEKLPYLSKLGTPVIVSISGESMEEFAELARRLDTEDSAAGLELNISCPNIKHNSPHTALLAQDKDATYELVKKIRETTQKTIITKLSPNVTSITEIARSACDAGADAVSMVNTFLGMAVNIETRMPELGNVTGGLSGPCIKPIALRMVWETAKVIDKPVIGIGGIMNSKDALEFMMAGAAAIQIGTANFIEPDVSEKVIKGIEDYLKKYKIKDIKEIIGTIKID